LAKVLGDGRRQASCAHSLERLLQQRLYGLALGYEDLNDHETLREDAALQTAEETDQALASASTGSTITTASCRSTCSAENSCW